MSKFKAELIELNGQQRIAVHFENDPLLIERFKKLNGRIWSVSLKVWHLPDTQKYRKMFGMPLFKQERFSIEVIENLEKFKEYLRYKRYSENTIKSYTESLKVFFNFYKEKSIDELTNENVVFFNTEYIMKKKLSATYQNQLVNALKLFFREVQNRNLEVDLIQRPRRDHKLPNVLSKKEVKAILEAPINLKHRMMLSLIYACGLRRSELLNLTLKDIHSERNLLLIRQSKGKKDRIVPIGNKLIESLREYYKLYKPTTWLFEGQKVGIKYSEESLAKVLKQSVSKTKISKPVTLHWLRHSYATHLLESGTDLRYIQELLGHSSSRTTEIYTHVSTKNIQNIISPFDSL